VDRTASDEVPPPPPHPAVASTVMPTTMMERVRMADFEISEPAPTLKSAEARAIGAAYGRR
jgi:hypothetical protein